MRRIMLPEPARTMLRRAGEPLTRALNEICEGRRPWALGGGTILAARWRHRRSKDLDIFVPEENPIETLRSKVDPRFCEAMTRCGAERFVEGEKSIKIWMPDGRIEISRLVARPPEEPERAMVEGFEMCVMSTAQILTGKIRGRSGMSPTRDILDAAVASRLDPDALRVAINSLDGSEQRALAAVLKARERHYRNTAPNEIEDLAEEFKWALTTAPEAYVRALEALKATTIGIESEGGQMRIVTVLGNGQWTAKRIEDTQIARALAEIGLSSWAARVGDGTTISRRVQEKHTERARAWNARWAASQHFGSSERGDDRIGRTIEAVEKETKGASDSEREEAWTKARDRAMGPTLVMLEGEEEALSPSACGRGRDRCRRDG